VALPTTKLFASTEASKARDRVGFGLAHRKEIFLLLFALREGGRGGEGTLPASLLEAGASFRHAQHDPKHPNFSVALRMVPSLK
jgi:hypothetical protein